MMEDISRSNLDSTPRSDLTKKERRELKRQEKAKEIASQSQQVKTKKFGKWIFILVLVALILGGLYYWLSGAEPEGEDRSVSYEILERTHIARPTPVTNYNSNPPTSGQHWSDGQAPIARGVHESEFPDEALVHNLEHGEIWISYQPDIPDNIKEELRSLVRDTYKTVLTVRSKNDTDIAIAGWGRLDKFDLNGEALDKQRIEDFISRYRNKGPELIP